MKYKYIENYLITFSDLKNPFEQHGGGVVDFFNEILSGKNPTQTKAKPEECREQWKKGAENTGNSARHIFDLLSNLHLPNMSMNFRKMFDDTIASQATEEDRTWLNKNFSKGFDQSKKNISGMKVGMKGRVRRADKSMVNRLRKRTREQGDSPELTENIMDKNILKSIEKLKNENKLLRKKSKKGNKGLLNKFSGLSKLMGMK